jgi:phosphoserine phosphatase RsbU/P
MATSPRPRLETPVRPQTEWFVHDLLKLQKAAQAINSTLDLDELIKKIAIEVADWFDCIETSIWLHDEATNEMVLAGVHGCTMYMETGIRLKVGEQGMIGYVAATGATRYAPDVSLDPHYIPCEPNTKTELDIPLKIGSKVIGVFSAVHHDIDGFPADQRRLLEALSGHVSLAIHNARAFRAEREQRERMQREAKEARVIQESLLPQASPFLPGFALEAMSVPAGEVGGDWYDYIDLGRNRWGVVLADVSGKGMAAALLMSATRGIVRSLARMSDSPAEVLTRLNCVLKDDFPSGRYVTMVYGVLDANARTFTFANAGHPHPIFVEGGSARAVNGVSGLPLGLGETVYSDHVIQLKHGVKLVLYSDGLSEAENREGEEFGARRISEHMLGEEANAQSLLNAVCDHAGHGDQGDDQTVILLHCVDETGLLC